MNKQNKEDITPSVNHIIAEGRKEKTINSKAIKVDYHTAGELYTRIYTLFRLSTAMYPELAFKSLKHYDEENDSISNFNGDFIVGLYTPKGPISFHFKLELLNQFEHIPLSEKAPLYDGYTEEEMIERLNSLSDQICSGKSIKDIIMEIEENPSLQESQKPKQYRF